MANTIGLKNSGKVVNNIDYQIIQASHKYKFGAYRAISNINLKRRKSNSSQFTQGHHNEYILSLLKKKKSKS